MGRGRIIIHAASLSSTSAFQRTRRAHLGQRILRFPTSSPIELFKLDSRLGLRHVEYTTCRSVKLQTQLY
jgi:hypothetical protein